MKIFGGLSERARRWQKFLENFFFQSLGDVITQNGSKPFNVHFLNPYFFEARKEPKTVMKRRKIGLCLFART